MEGRGRQAGALQYVVDEQGEPMALFIADEIRTWRDVVKRLAVAARYHLR